MTTSVIIPSHIISNNNRCLSNPSAILFPIDCKIKIKTNLDKSKFGFPPDWAAGGNDCVGCGNWRGCLQVRQESNFGNYSTFKLWKLVNFQTLETFKFWHFVPPEQKQKPAFALLSIFTCTRYTLSFIWLAQLNQILSPDHVSVQSRE